MIIYQSCVKPCSHLAFCKIAINKLKTAKQTTKSNEFFQNIILGVNETWNYFFNEPNKISVAVFVANSNSKLPRKKACSASVKFPKNY